MGGSLSSLKHAGLLFSQSLPPKSKFSVDQIPDLTGRVIIVTGGNTGVGKQTVKALLQHNAKVYLAARSEERAMGAISDLKVETGKEAIWLQLDLADLASVKKAATEFLAQEQELHVLFNNAGVMWPPVDQLTKDGYDMQFGTNVIGHFYFTELLIPALERGAQSTPDKHARIINTSSSGAYFETLHYETFREDPMRKKLGTRNLYFQSKFGNVVVAREFARRYADKGIVSVSCNPGNLKTDLQRYVSSIGRWFMDFMLYPAEYGALTQLWAGTMPDVLEHNGEFLIPWARYGRCREEAYDPKVGEDLWNWLQEQVKDQ